MSDYNKEWERTKPYLIRSLFHSVPHTGLPTISEESTQSSTTIHRGSSTDVTYNVSEESSDSTYFPVTHISRPAVTANDSLERIPFPLPPLIIEREPNKHDEPEEYYDKLLIRMKRVCKKLFKEGKSMSDDDFFIDIDNDEVCEQNGDSDLAHNIRNGESYNFDALNNTRHEPDNNNTPDINQDDNNTKKTNRIINNRNLDSLKGDLQDKLFIEHSTSTTDSGDSQYLSQTVEALVNASNGIHPKDISNINNTTDNTSVTQHLHDEDLLSSSRVYLKEIVQSEDGTPSIKIEEDYLNNSLSRTSVSRERSPSPMLICPYTPIKRNKKDKHSLKAQGSEDSHSPHYIEMTIQAEVHVDADFHCQDTLLVGLNTEQHIDSSRFQQLSPEEQINSLIDISGDTKAVSDILPGQNLAVQSSQEILCNRQTSVERERIKSPILISKYMSQNIKYLKRTNNKDESLARTKSTNLTISNVNSLPACKSGAAILEEIQDPNPSSSFISSQVRAIDVHLEEMRSIQPQTSVHSDHIDDVNTISNLDITFAPNSELILQDVTIRSQDNSMNIQTNRNKSSFEYTDCSNGNSRGRKRRHENSFSESDNNFNTSSNDVKENVRRSVTDVQNRIPTNKSSNIKPDIPQIMQMTVQATVHVDANLDSKDTLLIKPNYHQNEVSHAIVDPNVQQFQQLMEQDMVFVESELQTQRNKRSLNSKDNGTFLQAAQQSPSDLQRRPLQNESHINVVLEKIPDKNLPGDSRLPISHMETSIAPQEVLSESQISEGTKYISSPKLVFQSVPLKEMKQNVNSLVRHDNQNRDSTPSLMFKETLEQTLQRMYGISAGQNSQQSSQNISSDIEASSREVSSRDVVESDYETTGKSISPSGNLSGEEDISISPCDEDQDSSTSSEEQSHTSYIRTEEMRSSTSIDSVRIDDMNFTNNMDQSRNVTQEYTNGRNSNINPKSRKRSYDKITCQHKKIDWDTLGNIFVGEPKLLKLCSYEDLY